MGKTVNICHITTVHNSDDARIFHKECSSLSKAGYHVFLVAPGESRREKNVSVIGMGDKPAKIKDRATNFAKRTVSKALELKCDIYHLHDPELLLYAKKIKRSGARVIFDSHEDYYFGSNYFPRILVGILNWFYRWYESQVVSHLDGVICCYRKTQERLSKKCKITEMIYNFPIENENTITYYGQEKKAVLGYAGGISSIWNHKFTMNAIDGIQNAKFLLAGNIYDGYLKELKNEKGWEKTDYLGRVPFEEVNERVYAKANIGIALLTYIHECNGKEGNLSNTKLFEMMDAGLPVIATDFDLWKKVVLNNQCGICVNPYKVEEIKKAIVYLRDHPEERKKMGENAKKAIHSQYNWEEENKKLCSIYSEIVNL